MTYTPEYGPESRWTRPTAECPNPERWTSDDDDSTECEVSELVGAFVRALQPLYCVETGSAFGQTSELIGRALRANGQGRLVTLETELERVEYSRERCQGLPVEVRHQASLDFTPEDQIDFAFFDSLIPLRAMEFHQYRPFMHHRTIVGFHDTGSQHSLKPQIAALEQMKLIQPIYLPTPRGVCFARVL